MFGTSEVAPRVPSAILMALRAGLLTLIGWRLRDMPRARRVIDERYRVAGTRSFDGLHVTLLTSR